MEQQDEILSANMSTAQNDSRKRSKKRYGAGHHNKRWKGCRELEVGMEGILITCNMNERKCTAEAFNLLNEYADKLYGPEKVSEKTPKYVQLVWLNCNNQKTQIMFI